MILSVACVASSCGPVNTTRSLTDTTGVTTDTVTVLCDDGFAASGVADFTATCTAVPGSIESEWSYPDQCLGTPYHTPFPLYFAP